MTKLEARSIEGYGGDYLVTKDGQVWSLKGARPRRLSTTGGRVSLHANGKRSCPTVAALVEAAFGEDTPDDTALLEHVRERYGDHPDVARWMASLEQSPDE